MGMESVFRLSVVMGIVDKLTPKLPGVENGVSGALQNINNGFGAMQKAGAAMTGVGTAILGATAKLVTIPRMHSESLHHWVLKIWRRWKRQQRVFRISGPVPAKQIS